MIRFIVALSSEARPLIEHFRLSLREGAFRWYESETATLVVSGIGKTAAAAATAFLHAKTGEEPDASWLNVGIAGHRDRPPGELARAHAIADGASGDCFYPTLLGLPDLATARVRTVASAESEFESDDFYDMEAYGFYETALRFSKTELVQCLKIVSDNRETGTAALSRERVSELVAEHLEDIDQLSTHLTKLAPPRTESHALEPFLGTWHFSTTQARTLRRYLTRCRALDPENVPTPQSFPGNGTATEVLQELESRIRALALARQGY